MPLPEPRAMREVASQLAALLADAPPGAPEPRALHAADAPPRTVAVDGSSVVVAESGSHVVGAYRAASVTLTEGAPARHAQPATLALLPAPDASGVLAEAMKAAGSSFEPSRLPPAACLDALRALSEMSVARDALATMGRGDMLLLDGALAIRPPVMLLDRLLVDAAARGVDVVGVCKSTSHTVGGRPAVAACQLAARGLPTWWAELVPPSHVRGRVLVARLSPAEARAFRVDVAAADGDAPGALARLAALAGHPGYPGYPSPLAMAHQLVTITDDERRRLRAQLQDEAEARGASPQAWRAVFADYHDELELGV